MKRINLIIGLALATFSTGAIAATKCVWLNANNASCSTTSIYGSNRTDWELTCNITQNGETKKTDIKGIAACASIPFTAGNLVATSTLTLSDNPEENKYCWCKMISPAITSWVSTSSTTSCFTECSKLCTESIMLAVVNRSFLFSNILR